jgi:hypothetical protein
MYVISYTCTLSPENPDAKAHKLPSPNSDRLRPWHRAE